MPCYLLYGIRRTSINLAKAEIERIFGISFEERESSYQAGVYYAFWQKDSEQLLLKRNIDPFDGEPVEQDFPDYPVILYIDATERSSDLASLLVEKSDFELLREELI